VQRFAEAETDLAGGQLFKDGAGIGQRAGQAVQLGDDQGVAFSAGGQGFAQAWSVAVGAGQAVVDVDAGVCDAEVGKGIALGGEVLGVGGAAGVADEQTRSWCSPGLAGAAASLR